MNRALKLAKCEIIKLYREKLRVDGRLTNCETGDRIAIIKEIETQWPTFMQMGKYRTGIYHKGQVNQKLKCSKCLQTGHNSEQCENEVVCKSCKEPVHIMADCPYQLQDEMSDVDVDADNMSHRPTDDNADDESESTAEVDSYYVDLYISAAEVDHSSANPQSESNKVQSETPSVPLSTPSSTGGATSPSKKKLKPRRSNKASISQSSNTGTQSQTLDSYC